MGFHEYLIVLGPVFEILRMDIFPSEISVSTQMKVKDRQHCKGGLVLL